MPEEDRPAILAEITEAVRPALFEPEGRWVADYVRLRVGDGGMRVAVRIRPTPKGKQGVLNSLSTLLMQ